MESLDPAKVTIGTIHFTNDSKGTNMRKLERTLSFAARGHVRRKKQAPFGLIREKRAMASEEKEKTNHLTASDILGEWRQSAPYWAKHRDIIRTMFTPVTQALIEESGIVPGQSVLDVAGGPGEPSLTIARIVGLAGSVVCTDAVAEMVAAAESAAQRLEIRNISFRQCAADSLPFENNSFDAVVSRLGAMFFPDPLNALREMLRVTRPGGTLSLAVWHKSELNPFAYRITEVMNRYTETIPADPDAPGAF